jgi:hypothetical protein
VQLTDAGTYTVTVSNQAGSVSSSPATLTVTPATASTVITAQPVGGTFHTGESTTLSVTATGTDPLTYQWQHNGSDLAGQTGPALILSNLSAGNAGEYLVIVSGRGGSVTSASATLAVVPLSAQLLSLNSGGATLTLQTIPGRSYVIEATDTLVGANWQQIGTVNATDATSTFTDSQTSASARFWQYRSGL